jgi:hypothetical protein
LTREVRRTGRSLKAAVNDALRVGLGLAGRPRRVPRFKVDPHPFGLKPGIDADHLNQLADELEVEAATSGLRR